jgi:hypothetical protein
MPSSVESEIESLVAAFVADLTNILRVSALGMFEEALGGQGTARAKRSTSRAPRAAAPARTPKGAKRDPKAIEALTEKLAAFIKKTPGQRIEQVGKALAVSTRELALPVKKLIAAKRVSTKGHKRATTYFPR